MLLVSYHAIIELSSLADTSHAVVSMNFPVDSLYTVFGMLLSNVMFSIFCLCIELFPKNALSAFDSVVVVFNVLYIDIFFCTLPFPFRSITLPSAILIFSCFMLLPSPDNTSLYCCKTVFSVPSIVAVASFSVTLVIVFVTVLVSVPFNITVMSFAVIVSDVFKYLSDTLNTTVAVWSPMFTSAVSLSITGLNVSTFPMSSVCSLLVFRFPSDTPVVAPDASSVIVPAAIFNFVAPLYS